MDTFLKNLGITLIAIGAIIVIPGGIAGLVYAVVADVPATPIAFLTGGIGMLFAVSGLLPLALRLFLPYQHN